MVGRHLVKGLSNVERDRPVDLASSVAIRRTAMLSDGQFFRSEGANAGAPLPTGGSPSPSYSFRDAPSSVPPPLPASVPVSAKG